MAKLILFGAGNKTRNLLSDRKLELCLEVCRNEIKFYLIFFLEYETSIWVDASLSILRDLRNIWFNTRKPQIYCFFTIMQKNAYMMKEPYVWFGRKTIRRIWRPSCMYIMRRFF